MLDGLLGTPLSFILLPNVVYLETLSTHESSQDFISITVEWFPLSQGRTWPFLIGITLICIFNILQNDSDSNTILWLCVLHCVHPVVRYLNASSFYADTRYVQWLNRILFCLIMIKSYVILVLLDIIYSWMSYLKTEYLVF